MLRISFLCLATKKVPWKDEILRSFSISFLSMRLSSTAKTWNCDSVAIPIAPIQDKRPSFEATEQAKEKRNLYSLSLCYFLFFSFLLGSMICETYGMRRGRKEEELCIEIRPTKTHIPQSKIRPDFIPNLPKFPSWFELQGKQWKKYI